MLVWEGMEGEGHGARLFLDLFQASFHEAFFREVCQALQLEDFALENQPTAGPTALSSPLSP